MSVRRFLNKVYFIPKIEALEAKCEAKGSESPLFVKMGFGALCAALIPAMAMGFNPFDHLGIDETVATALSYSAVGYLGLQAAWTVVLTAQTIHFYTGFPSQTMKKEA